MQPSNLAARAGRWSAQHRKTAILGWIVFVVLAVVVGGRIGLNALDEAASGSGESKRGDMVVEAAGFPDQAGEQVLVQGAGGQEREAAVRDVVARLARIASVAQVQQPVTSEDGRSMLVRFAMRGDKEQASKLVEQPVAAVAGVQRAHPSVRVEQFGEASATKAIAAQDAKDSKKAHLISYSILLVILLAAFGAVVAAGLPLVLGATAVAATVGLLGPVSQLYALPADVAELVAIIGLAVGVDYAMFYSRRVMEERDRGHSVEDAVERAAATSGRAVLISGLTVMTAMAGLLFSGNAIFVGFGIGTMLVVAAAMLGSLTFLPRCSRFLSRKNWLEKGRVPYIAKRRHAGQGRVALLGRRPGPRPEAPAGCRRSSPAACSSPSASPRWHASSRTRASTATRAASRGPDPRPLQAAFPGGAVPATDGRSRPTTSPPRRPGRDRAAARPRAGHGQLSEPSHVEISPDKTGRRRRALGEGQRHRRRLRALARDAAQRRSSRPPSASCRRRGRSDRRDRRLEGLQRRPDSRTRRSCSRSCSASRSSCCWSRSARSWCRSRRSS
jgi:RND superfamily putative drug exporter